MAGKLTLISLFAGAGGLDLGLEDAGFETVVANDVEEHTCESLLANQAIPRLSLRDFNKWFEGQLKQRCYQGASPEQIDSLKSRVARGRRGRSYLRSAEIVRAPIEAISSRDLLRLARLRKGEVDLVAGGPPCQPFSRAGKRMTVEAAEGRLFVEFVRVVREVRPRWFLFENVKGLTQSKTDVVYLQCAVCKRKSMCDFCDRSHAVAERLGAFRCACGSTNGRVVVDTKRGGSLDIIVNEFEKAGYHCCSRILNAVDFGVPQFRERLFIIGSRDGERFSWPAPTHREVSSHAQQDLFSSSQAKQHWVSIREALWRDGHPVYGTLDPEKALLWVKNVVRPHDEPVTWKTDQPAPTIGAHQAAKLAIAPLGVPAEQLRRQQWHTLGRRQGDSAPVFVEHAYLSDEELLTLQTFPEHWYLFGTRMQRAFQIGNAVPPRLACAVGRQIASTSRE
jgi:DNA (cytosine-5)-methyltransferase 1